LSEAATVNQITLHTRETTLHFLSTRPDPDEIITWTCPECHAVNIGTYHSHITRCGACGEGHFPAIPLPIVGDAKTSVKRAFMNDRLTQIDKDIKEAEDEIRSLECQINDQERYIRRWKEEQEDLKHQLHLDVVNGWCIGGIEE
jgi:hypothetical protein